MIRSIIPSDSPQIAKIYNHYILNGVATFEEDALSDKNMAIRIEKVSKKYPWIILEVDSRIVGYAYANQWKTRSAYNYTVESSVYLDPNELGKGYGKRLYTQLINQLKEMDIHTVIGGITLPNPASIHMHEQFGFKKTGQFDEVDLKFGKRVDVGYWQLIFKKG